LGEALVRGRGKGQPGALAALDEGADLALQLPPFVALLWLTALPGRLLLVAFLVELVDFGETAPAHGRALLGLAFASLALWLLSLWGRQVFIRACRRALAGDAGLRLEGLRVPPGEMAGALGAALLVELTFWALLFTVLIPVAMVAGAALAAVAAPRAGPRLWAGVQQMAQGSGRLLALAVLLWLCLVGVLLAAINLHLLFALAVGLLSSLFPFDAPVWREMLEFGNPLYFALLGLGAALLVEPFWLAAVTVHVERARSRSSGEDLRQTFEDFRRRDARDAA
jgi:hypothetical protein